MNRQLLLLSVLLVNCLNVSAALDKFSKLDQIENWIIERRIDSLTKAISCRAYMKGYSTWFSSRIRLNPDDELIIPEEFSIKKMPSEKTLKKVKTALT